jgi:hypothetical protein
MGRTAAYTGKTIKWSDMMEKPDSPYYKLTLKPAALDFEKGPVTAPPDDVCPIPGRA